MCLALCNVRGIGPGSVIGLMATGFAKYQALCFKGVQAKGDCRLRACGKTQSQSEILGIILSIG